jgi:hypothetical protein
MRQANQGFVLAFERHVRQRFEAQVSFETMLPKALLDSSDALVNDPVLDLAAGQFFHGNHFEQQ